MAPDMSAVTEALSRKLSSSRRSFNRSLASSL